MNTRKLWLVLQLMRFVIAFMCAGYAMHECVQGLSSDKWPTTKGKITSATIKKVNGKFGTRDEAEIQYQYAVNGKTFTSDRIKFGGMGFKDQSLLVAVFKPQKEVDVHYKSGEPAVACLETGVNETAVGLWLALAFLLSVIAFEDKGKNKFGRLLKVPVSSYQVGNTKAEANSVKGILVFGGLVLLLVASKQWINGIHFAGLPGNILLAVALFGGGLAFVIFMTSLMPIAAGLMRARKLKLAEFVAKLNTALNAGGNPPSYEAAVAYGLEAEIAQEQLNYPKAMELSKKALSIATNRKNIEPEVRQMTDEMTERLVKKHMEDYEKNNAIVPSLCHESLGCILFDMGLRSEAMSQAEKAKRIAQEAVKTATGINEIKAKLALSCALALQGRCEIESGSLDEAKHNIQEAIRLRKELPNLYEEKIATNMAELALVYSMQSESRTAERTIEDGLKIVEASAKPSHRLAKAKLRASLAEVKMRTGQLMAAEKLLNESLCIREEILQPGHPEIAKSYLALASLRELQGKQRDAASYRKSADEMLTSCFGFGKYQAV